MPNIKIKPHISAYQLRKEYDLARGTLWNWVKKGYIDPPYRSPIDHRSHWFDPCVRQQIEKHINSAASRKHLISKP